MRSRLASFLVRPKTISFSWSSRSARRQGPRPEETFLKACGQLRLSVAQKYNDKHKLLDPGRFEFLWVTNFPMFEWDEEDKRWVAAHHPFTSVVDEDIEALANDPGKCRARAYDLVFNGTELALRLDSYSSPRPAVQSLRGARHG